MELVKSSVLQALSFVRAFADGNITQYFDDRGWSPSDLRPRMNMRTIVQGSRTIRLASNRPLVWRLAFEASDAAKVLWEFSWSYSTSSVLSERVWVQPEGGSEPRSIYSYARPTRAADPSADALRIEDLKLPGSLLAFIPASRLALEERDAPYLVELLAWARGITSLELLSPVAMRRGARGRPKDIGPRGERLTGFIASLTPAKKEELISRVRRFYPIESLETTRKTAGWVDMRIGESFPGSGRIAPTHMSDGFLRILALCSIPDFEDRVSLILLDEVEDGIEPHILPELIRFVNEQSNAQFIMTSHSPLLVNHFDADQVYFLTRRLNGFTALASPADMELFLEGAEFFGIGEIWANASSANVAKAIVQSDDRDDDDDDTNPASPSERAARFLGSL